MDRIKSLALAGSCLTAGLVVGLVGGWLGATATPLAIGAESVVDTGPARVRPAAPDYSRYRKIDLLARALSTVEQHYVRPVDGDELVYAAVRGLVSELDPHTEFLDPREARLLREEIEGAFGGVGMVVTLARDDDGKIFLDVRDVVAEGPAARSGVQVGARVVAIEGRPVAQFTDLREAIMVMRGEPGTAVRFTVEPPDGGERRELRVRREIIDSPPVQTEYLGEGIGVLRLTDFPEAAAKDLRRGLQELRGTAGKTGMKGLVLDLRDNGGGLLGEAVRIVDLFVSKGTIVRTRGRRGQLVDEARARAPGTESKLPLVVLVNKTSASASEIVAGALQDHGRALVIGERSYGKGSVQAPFELGDGSLLKLTIALYYTPHDRLIQASGIVPDVWVGMPPDGLAQGAEDSRPGVQTERDLPRHLTPDQFGRALGSDPSDGPAIRPAVRAAGDDAQLRAAVEHLQAWETLGPARRRR